MLKPKDPDCGLRSPECVPYRPNGELQRVVPVIEELKIQCENTLELSPDAQKAVNQMKRNVQYMNAEDPERTWESIRKGVLSMHNTRGAKGVTASPNKRSKFGPDGKRKTGFQINP